MSRSAIYLVRAENGLTKIGIAISPRHILREAARKTGMSMTQFIIQHGLIASEEIIRKNRERT